MRVIKIIWGKNFMLIIFYFVIICLNIIKIISDKIVNLCFLW